MKTFTSLRTICSPAIDWIKPISKKLAVFIVLALTSTEGFSDAWTHYSGACNWFRNRYKAHVGIKREGQVGSYCSKTEGDCYNVELLCRYPDINPYIPFQYTYAKAYAKINDTQNICEIFGGLEAGRQWLAGADVLLKRPIYSPYPMVERVTKGDKRDVTEKSSIGRIVFDLEHHVIHLYNVSGTIEVESFDKAGDFGAIAISVTKGTVSTEEPTDEEYVKSLIWESKCFVNNGRILTKGAFQARSFNSKVADQKLTTSVFVEHIAIPVDASIDMATLQVNMGVDNGNIGMGVSDKFSLLNPEQSVQVDEPADLNELLELSSYPNPVTDGITEVSFKINRNEQVQLALFDENGTLLQTIFAGTAIKNEEQRFKVSLKKITGRAGYVKLILSDKTLVRKILLTP